VRSARRLSVIAVLAAAVVAACAGNGATAPPTDPATGASAPPTLAPATVQPTAPAVTEPPATPEPATPEPATPEPEPTPTEDSSGADTCTGNEENIDFYIEIASKVDWAVYCPALPRGWFVGTGQWRLADGGRLEISYRGPDGAGLMLQEGSFCPGDGDCVPPGEDVGPADFADREGTLVSTADGWAVVVDRGERPSWLLTVTGLGEAAARQIAADLVEVDA
jgi:hypothetical protein